MMIDLQRTSLPVLLCSALVLPIAACDSKEKDDSTDKSAEKNAEEKKPEKKEPATLLAEGKPTVPSIFKGIKPGMTLEDAKKLHEGLPKEDSIEDPSYDGMYFHIYIPEDDGIVKTLRFGLPKTSACFSRGAAWIS